MMKKWQSILDNQTAVSKEEMLIINTLSFLQVQRLKQGISQTDFSKKIGMTQPQLAKIERLDTVPTLGTLNRYAAGLGLQVNLSLSPLDQVE